MHTHTHMRTHTHMYTHTPSCSGSREGAYQREECESLTVDGGPHVKRGQGEVADSLGRKKDAHGGEDDGAEEVRRPEEDPEAHSSQEQGPQHEDRRTTEPTQGDSRLGLNSY